MSITDGQVMVEKFSPEQGWTISVKAGDIFCTRLTLKIFLPLLLLTSV